MSHNQHENLIFQLFHFLLIKDADDQLLDSRTSTMFVIGQHSNMCGIDEMEDMREKMKAENSLLVVGGADDELRVSKDKKKEKGLTQVMVDRKILVISNDCIITPLNLMMTCE